MKSRTGTRQLPLSFVVVITVLLLEIAGGVYSTLTINSSVVDLVTKGMIDTASDQLRTANTVVEHYVEEKSKQAEQFLGNSLTINESWVNSAPQLSEADFTSIADSVQSSSIDIQHSYYANSSGVFYESPAQPHEAGWNYQNQPWYKNALASPADVGVTPAFIDEDGTKLVAVFSKQTTGALVRMGIIVIRADALGEQVRFMNVSKTGYLVLLTNSGLILGDSAVQSFVNKTVFETKDPGMIIAANGEGPGHWVALNAQNSRFLPVGESLGVTGLKAVAMISEKDVSDQSSVLASTMTWNTAIRFLIALAVSIGLAWFFVRPIEHRLREKTSSLQDILDNSGQGFFTYGPSLKADQSYSYGCVGMFGGPVGGRDVGPLLYDTLEDQETFTDGMKLIFSKGKGVSALLGMQKPLIHKDGRYLEVKFKRTAPDSILAIITDVTVATELQERKRAQDAQHNRVLRALNNRYAFNQFMTEIRGVIEQSRLFGNSAPEDLDAFVREVHTLKSNAGFFLFNETATAVHEYESELQNQAVFGGEVEWMSWGSRISQCFNNDLAAVLALLGEGWLSEVGSIPLTVEDYSWLRRYIQKNFPFDHQLMIKLNDIGHIRVHEIFSRIPDLAVNLAQRLGKKIAPITIAPHQVRVDREKMQALVSSCSHIVNNMVDHGIEGPLDRVDLGKHEEGVITVEFRSDEKNLEIIFADDGAGINKSKLLENAKKKKLVPENAELSDKEIDRLVFVDGLSTKAKVSETSGRGVGMSSVLSEVKALGGDIEIISKPGKGTTFILRVPRASVSDAVTILEA